MESVEAAVQRLRVQIDKTESRLKKLKCQLVRAQEQQREISHQRQAHHTISNKDMWELEEVTPGPLESNRQTNINGYSVWPLPRTEYKRYGRQMIVPRVGLQGQLSLRKASVLIVGLGGLGCPAAAYLAGAGVGTIGLIDGDTVELSNLHRQIIHSASTIGQYKVDSAVQYLRNLNPLPTYRTYSEHLQPQNATALFEQYTLILDCTDQPTSRYMISDATVLAGKPLISASALGLEGQLLTLNNDYDLDKGVPKVSKYCYRCVHPKSPSPDAVRSCSESGILGPIVGVMGTLMATAAFRILMRRPVPFTDDCFDCEEPFEQPSMLLFSANSDPMFRQVKIKGRRDGCPSCGTTPTITRESLSSGSLDYVAFCGARDPADILEPGNRLTPTEFLTIRETTLADRCILVDVRNETEYEMGHIDGSLNVPIDRFTRKAYSDVLNEPLINKIFPWSRPAGQPSHHPDITPDEVSVFTICRHSNDSQLAAKFLRGRFPHCKFIGDIKGGLEAWRKEVDPTFPDY
ncbi:MAG: hypothetical protein L6R35_002361 [Caloplaca aegaea]|nr:MAG: hypothetical protein L6R35_002361 [Caloplaca aegaea]